MNPNAELTQCGYCTLGHAFSENEVRAFCAELLRCESLSNSTPVQNLLKISTLVRSTAYAPALMQPVRAYLGESAVPFSAFFLDKSTHSNWQMPWHQNLRIPVESPAHAPALVENGVAHVIPDAAYLDNVVIARISLDAQTTENGALEIVPGSHRRGILADTTVAEVGDSGAAICPALTPGSIFIFKALLVHRSKPSLVDASRRVLQIEYAPEPPPGFRWFGLT